MINYEKRSKYDVKRSHYFIDQMIEIKEKSSVGKMSFKSENLPVRKIAENALEYIDLRFINKKLINILENRRI